MNNCREMKSEINFFFSISQAWRTHLLLLLHQQTKYIHYWQLIRLTVPRSSLPSLYYRRIMISLKILTNKLRFQPFRHASRGAFRAYLTNTLELLLKGSKKFLREYKNSQIDKILIDHHAELLGPLQELDSCWNSYSCQSRSAEIKINSLQMKSKLNWERSIMTRWPV